jgi:hypothetical protein
MEEDAAVELACKYASQRGYDTTAYDTKTVRQPAGWEIYFQPKTEKPRPGDFFSIYVSNLSGTVERLVPGK